MTLDFMLDKYTELCETIRRLDYSVMTVRDFLKAGQPDGARVILRHDVDRRMDAALRMAELESEYDISATYYVRTIRAVFKPEALRRLHQLGHEVGYHYEVLAKAKGDHKRAIVMFEQELQQFRQIVSIETISMHGSPLSAWDNRDLWCIYDFKQYDLLEAYLSVDYKNAYYFTDTGRSWDAARYNLRDRVSSCNPNENVHTTNELIAFLRRAPNRPVLINTHPNRWATTWEEWGASATSDWIINQVKQMIIWQREIVKQIKG